ncbi:hypothetical protein LVJ94_34595 [Pendulispora rubella]|uniref:DUF6985 domain-containing protein n=1 Tax=Pendulispora rubella TaxID=2741070 RepID=A0ABZ2KTJ7_9BACT
MRNNPARLTVAEGELDVRLAVWAGFRAGKRAKPSKGDVCVSVGGDAMVEDDDEITAEQHTAYRTILDDADAMQHAIVDAIVLEYPKIRAKYNGFQMQMPAQIDATSIRDLIELTSISIHNVHADGVAYVGYSLACAWDSEHSVGVMTHGRRVVEVGGADTAILAWIAERDLERR